MGADFFYVFFGVRYEVQTDQELEQLELGTDPRLTAARKAHLKTCFDRLTDGEPHFLLIGSQIGAFGVEAKPGAMVSEQEMRQIVDETKQKLKEAGFNEEPRFHFQLAAQH